MPIKRFMMFLITALVVAVTLHAEEKAVIEIGTFNIEWFPCKDDGAMLREYGIDLRYPPQGEATDVEGLFSMLDKLDIELLAVNEIVDTDLFEKSAKRYLDPAYKFIYASSGGDQRVGFLYDSRVLELQGRAETYMSVALSNDSRLRPAFRAYFKYKPNGYDFHAIVTHLKASPSGWSLRKKQWRALEEILANLETDSGDGDIILLGDFNNVSTREENEFLPLIRKLNFYRATSELMNGGTSYWQPDYEVERIQASTIDHIFISADARIEYVKNSLKVGGMCARKQAAFRGDSIPEYYRSISDHCPVFVSFRADKDND